MSQSDILACRACAREPAPAGRAKRQEAAVIQVFLIRHGQSESNAGLPSADPGAIPLTAAGHRQAEQVARALADVPALIVTSTYLRARQTAQPTVSRFPAAACQEWPVHEFTYLGDLHGRASTPRGTRALRPGVLGPGRASCRQHGGRVLRRPARPNRWFPEAAWRPGLRAGRGVHPRAVHASRRVVPADRHHDSPARRPATAAVMRSVGLGPATPAPHPGKGLRRALRRRRSAVR